MNYSSRLGALAGLVAISTLVGCSSFLPSSGPSRAKVEAAAESQAAGGIQIVEISDTVARQLLASQKQRLFSETLGAAAPKGYLVGKGDSLEISLWEAPPATLFGSMAVNVLGGPATSQVTNFPEQMVNNEGVIKVPFAGDVPAAGHSLSEIEQEIARRLQGKANQPQVLARLTKNVTENVTVVGEVSLSTRMALTPRRERLLDALAAAGGVKQPVDKMTIQVTRLNKTYSLPLETIIRDPQQNIVLQAGDVVTAFYKPLSFTVLGAAGKNDEVNFEAQGITLAQGLARVGGLQDSRADARGVFIFRYEAPNAVDWPAKPPLTTPDGKVPVIYRADLKDPAIFFAAQNFMVRDRDLLYISNATGIELQKFLAIITTIAYPALTAKAALQ